MKERDVAALIVGLILGCVGAYLDIIMASFFALPGMFILCCLVLPLLVSLISARKTILLGLVPNLVMILGLVFYFSLAPSEEHSWFDTFYLLMLALGVAISLALIVSVPIHLLRQKLRRPETPRHIFQGDAQQIVGPERRERVSQHE
jgi:uncharacterized membrane protein YhdT